MPKNSTVQTEQTNPQTQANTAPTGAMCVDRAREKYLETAQLFAVFLYIDTGADKDGITHGLPHAIGHYTSRSDADKAGLNALEGTLNAVSCEVLDITRTPVKALFEGVDNQDWVHGITRYFETVESATDYAKQLFTSGRKGITYKTARIKNLLIDHFTGYPQKPLLLTNYTPSVGEFRGGAL